MSFWAYTPKSSGEMIDYGSEKPLETRSLPYLEQAKKHLEGYPELWKLYQSAPELVKRKEEAQKLLDHFLDKDVKHIIWHEAQKIDPEITKPEMTTIALRYPRSVYDRILDAIKTGKKVKFGQESGEAAVFLNNAIDNEFLYFGIEAAHNTIAGLEQEAETNRNEFTKLLKEVIESIRLSDFESMKGKCELCPMPY